MNKARIKCPLCEWIYDIKPLHPQAADPMALASVFGPGVFTTHAVASQARDTEEALRGHFATHTTVEWVAKVTKLKTALSQIQWVKDCGIDSIDPVTRTMTNHPDEERDSMYRIATEAIGMSESAKISAATQSQTPPHLRGPVIQAHADRNGVPPQSETKGEQG